VGYVPAVLAVDIVGAFVGLTLLLWVTPRLDPDRAGTEPVPEPPAPAEGPHLDEPAAPGDLTLQG
jgi:hypothetical protein